MINYIWAGMIIISLICAFFTGRLDQTIAGGLDGAKSAVEMVITLAGMMCLWSGFMSIAEKSGLIKKIAKWMKPVIKFLFPEIAPDSKAAGAITMNMVANIMGLANAATPLGLKAMEELDIENGHKKKASNAMCMFVVINTASIQLIPSTVIALRSASGSVAPASIIIPVWITSVAALTVGIIMVKINERIRRKEP